MKIFPTIPLCPKCAGHRFKRSRLYPQNRYCKKHGIRMHPFDFSQFDNMFSALSSVRLFLVYCDLFKVTPIFSPGLDVNMNLKEILQRVVDIYDALKGEPDG